MPAPQSVVKTHKIDSKCYVEFTDSVEKSEYYIFELTRAALRDVGKFLRNEWKAKYYSHFKKVTGSSSRGIKTRVFSNKNTIYPRLEIGLPITPAKSKKANKHPFYAYFQEFGSSKTPKLGLLTHAVQDNIATIRAIEAQYLDYINKDEAEISSRLIPEEDIDED